MTRLVAKKLGTTTDTYYNDKHIWCCRDSKVSFNLAWKIFTCCLNGLKSSSWSSQQLILLQNLLIALIVFTRMEYRTEHIISINMGINFFIHLYNKMWMKSFHEFSGLHFWKDWERMDERVCGSLRKTVGAWGCLWIGIKHWFIYWSRLKLQMEVWTNPQRFWLENLVNE